VFGALGGFAVLVTLLVLSIVSPAVWVWLLSLALSVAPLAVAALAAMSARKWERRKDEAVNEARLLVAGDVLASTTDEISARRLAETLRLDEARAEQLLARLNLEDFVSSRITAEGDVVYSVRAPARLRLPMDELPSTPPPGTLDEAGARLDVEEPKRSQTRRDE
jgi:hypothetical protein